METQTKRHKEYNCLYIYTHILYGKFDYINGAIQYTKKNKKKRKESKIERSAAR